MKKTKSFQKKPEKLLGTEREGLLVAHFGAVAEVENENGQIIRCHIRKNLEPIITGDRVLWLPEDEETGIIVDYLPRRSLMSRPEGKNKLKLLAANVDVLLIVCAPQGLSEYLIDRYIIAAENLQIKPVIVLNKMDLLDETNSADIKSRLGIYEKIGYPVIYSSIYLSDGLSVLAKFLQEKNAVLVGASGVGKSSIISSFIPDQIIKVGETSNKGSGKHTTTMTRLYHLPTGGNLIDSPGMREFNLWHMKKENILEGFIEFQPFINQCKFSDCQHAKEPGCALIQAVNENKIPAIRLASYHEIVSHL